MKLPRLILLTAISLAFVYSGALAQDSTPTINSRTSLDESGETTVDGRTVPYLIRRLPVNSFPDLPDAVADALDERGCLIPQTYQAHRPENVVHASLERAGSSDWAVLCSARGTVTLLVFFAHNPNKPVTLASVREMERLQSHGTSGVLGFDWGIDPASPEQVREAQAGFEHHPPLLDHDALVDTVLNQKTVYHFYAHSAWTLVDMPQ